MDVGCLLIRHIDRICWDVLADPDSPYEIAVPVLYGQTIANHFVAARKNNVFIEKWHQLFMHLWNGRTHQQGISDNPLLGFIKDIRYDDATDFHWDWKVQSTPCLNVEGVTSAGGPLSDVQAAGVGNVLEWSRTVQRLLLTF